MLLPSEQVLGGERATARRAVVMFMARAVAMLTVVTRSYMVVVTVRRWNVPRWCNAVLPVFDILRAPTWKLVMTEVMVGTRNISVRVTTTAEPRPTD